MCHLNSRLLIKNSSYTLHAQSLKPCCAHEAPWFQEEPGIKWVSSCPTSLAACQMVPVHTSVLPGSDTSLWGYFCSKEIMAVTYGMSTLQEQKKSPVFTSASHLAFGATVRLCDWWHRGRRTVVGGVDPGAIAHRAAGLRSKLNLYFSSTWYVEFPHLSGGAGSVDPIPIPAYVSIGPRARAIGC